ncbi:hypothetical protein DPMN_164925, partial [Dreissena polymorpha]
KDVNYIKYDINESNTNTKCMEVNKEWLETRPVIRDEFPDWFSILGKTDWSPWRSRYGIRQAIGRSRVRSKLYERSLDFPKRTKYRFYSGPRLVEWSNCVAAPEKPRN